jgi:hypothetical protein
MNMVGNWKGSCLAYSLTKSEGFWASQSRCDPSACGMKSRRLNWITVVCIRSSDWFVIKPAISTRPVHIPMATVPNHPLGADCTKAFRETYHFSGTISSTPLKFRADFFTSVNQFVIQVHFYLARFYRFMVTCNSLRRSPPRCHDK